MLNNYELRISDQNTKRYSFNFMLSSFNLETKITEVFSLNVIKKCITSTQRLEVKVSIHYTANMNLQPLSN